MDSITIKYTKSSVVHSKTFNALWIKGHDEPDKVRLVPQYQPELADGSIRSYFKGFQRVICTDFGVITSAADRRLLNDFLVANTKSISYKGNLINIQEAQVINLNVDGFETTWDNDLKLTPRYYIELVETTVRTVWPADVPAIADTLMYIQDKEIEVTGTEASPETFTTNVGKLLYNYGTTSYPAISLLSYNPQLILTGPQDANIHQVGGFTQSGSNIQFQLAVTTYGNPKPADGKYYIRLGIALQAIV